jgi:long-chain acyl-CoA synthetase
METNLVTLLRTHATQKPQSPCLTFGTETLSFADVDARASRVARALEASGIQSGDRVAIVARNTSVHFELFFGCAKSGAIFVPINWRLSAREIADILADSSPSLLFIEDEFQPLLSLVMPHQARTLLSHYPTWRDSAYPDDDDHTPSPNCPLLLLYTSGTTGIPKGVVLSHGNLSYLARMAHELWDMSDHSVNLVASPLFHIGGIGYAMTCMSQGGHTVLMQQVVPRDIAAAIRDHKVTHGFFVPTVIQMLLDLPEVAEIDLTSLNRIVYGAAPIGEAVLKKAIEIFGCGFMHTYGMTETGGTVVMLAPEEHEPDGPFANRLRSCGRPMPWNELMLVNPATENPVEVGEVGEIRIRSKANMLRYWNKPEETARAITADGWLRTGDAAYRDEDGFIYMHDRYKDMIVSGAENIYPTEIENVLYQHSDVAQVAVIGVPHERWGETPKAFVVVRNGSHPSESELIAFTRAQLAHYKCPTSVAFVTQLPTNASGKILKKEMRNPEWLKENA